MRRRPSARREPFYEALVESAPDAIVVVDADGTIVYANRRSEELSGWRRDDLVGRSIEVLVPAASRDDHPAHRLAYAGDPRARPMGAGLDLHLSTVDGHEVAVDISLSPLGDDGRLTAAAIRDITDRRRTELQLRAAREDLERTVDELRRTSELLAAANELGDLLHSCRSVEDAYEVLVRYGRVYFPGSSGGVYRSEVGGQAQLVRTWGDADRFDPLVDADGCWAFRRGRLHLHRGAEDLSCAHLDPACRSACAPLLANGELLGLLVVCLGDGTDPPEDLEARARSLAEHLSLGLANIVLRETLEAQSIRDPLTGLHNRRFLDEQLRRELTRSHRSGSSVAVLSIDLDRFKEFNDDFGHGAGDRALVSVASLLLRGCREEDVVYRLGGEEFLVVLPGTTAADALARAEELREACRELPLAPGRVLTMSIGVAASPQHGRTPEALLDAGDRALYRAKRGGRDRVAVATDDDRPG